MSRPTRLLLAATAALTVAALSPARAQAPTPLGSPSGSVLGTSTPGIAASAPAAQTPAPPGPVAQAPANPTPPNAVPNNLAPIPAPPITATPVPPPAGAPATPAAPAAQPPQPAPTPAPTAPAGQPAQTATPPTGTAPPPANVPAPGTAPGTPAPPGPPQPTQPPQLTPPAEGPAWLPMGHVTLDVLDTVTGQVHEIKGAVGATLNVETLTITTKGCYARPPSMRADSTAWVAITDSDHDHKDFAGWLLAQEPALSSFDNANYNVRLVACTP